MIVERAKRAEVVNHHRDINLKENVPPKRRKAQQNHLVRLIRPESHGKKNRRPDQAQAGLEGLKNRVRGNRPAHQSAKDHPRDRLVQDRLAPDHPQGRPVQDQAAKVILEAVAVEGNLRGEDDRDKLIVDDNSLMS